MSSGTRRTKSTTIATTDIKTKASVVTRPVVSRSISSTNNNHGVSRSKGLKCGLDVLIKKALEIKTDPPSITIINELDELSQKLLSHDPKCSCRVARDKVLMAAGHCYYESFLVSLNEFNIIMDREEKQRISTESSTHQTSRESSESADNHVSGNAVQTGSRLDGIVDSQFHNVTFQNEIILKRLDQAVSYWTEACQLLPTMIESHKLYQQALKEAHAAFYIYRCYRIILQQEKCTTVVSKLASITKYPVDQLKGYCISLHLALETGDMETALRIIKVSEVVYERVVKTELPESFLFYILVLETKLRSGKSGAGKELKDFIDSDHLKKNTLTRYFPKAMALVIASKFPDTIVKHSDYWDEFFEPLSMCLNLVKRWNKTIADVNTLKTQLSASEVSDEIWFRFASYHLFLESYSTTSLFYFNMSSIVDIEYFQPMVMRLCRKYCFLYW